MKKWNLLGLISFTFAFLGCSQTNTTEADASSINVKSYVSEDLARVKNYLDSSNKEIIASWQFKDPSNVGKDFSRYKNDAEVGEGAPVIRDSALSLDGASGLKVNLFDSLKTNDFAIEARIYPTAFGEMNNIVAAEPPGRYGDGWILRLEEGRVVFLMRDADEGASWFEVLVGDTIPLNEWTTVRIERIDSVTAIYMNGFLKAAASFRGDVAQMTYGLGIGYDAMNQANHNRYFSGKIDYIRIEKLISTAKSYTETSSSSAVDTSVVEDSSFADTAAVDSSESSSSAAVVAPDSGLLVAWEFNDSANVGLDATGNGNNAFVGEGSPVIEDSVLVLDSSAGLIVPLTETFKRNEFVLEVRIYPTEFNQMNNIVAAEPPGSYGDGWILRLDSGTLQFHARDAAQGTEWNVFTVDTLSLNQWTTIRVEKTSDSIQVSLNGEIRTKVAFDGDLAQLGYDLGIGYDAMNQNNHDRYFKGKIDYIRFYAN
ncbi:MAG: LamG domain-containing protein [Fibrobacteraceae bacterium]|nr:LamG domain-containing protein [Fibrobacteraceae bacterium]